MPYIPALRRRALFRRDDVPQSAGELNYEITRLINAYMRHHGLSYATINDIVGAAEGAKLEFYRRVAVPYEDKKLADNGDVYSVSNLTS